MLNLIGKFSSFKPDRNGAIRIDFYKNLRSMLGTVSSEIFILCQADRKRNWIIPKADSFPFRAVAGFSNLIDNPLVFPPEWAFLFFRPSRHSQRNQCSIWEISRVPVRLWIFLSAWGRKDQIFLILLKANHIPEGISNVQRGDGRNIS